MLVYIQKIHWEAFKTENCWVLMYLHAKEHVSFFHFCNDSILLNRLVLEQQCL